MQLFDPRYAKLLQAALLASGNFYTVQFDVRKPAEVVAPYGVLLDMHCASAFIAPSHFLLQAVTTRTRSSVGIATTTQMRVVVTR